LRDIGASDAFAGEGVKSYGVTIKTHTRKLISPNFKDLAKWTNFPYATLISQADTEAILDKLLVKKGVTVLRPVRVVGVEELEDASDPHNLLVSFDSGAKLRTKYLIGADGSKSTVSCSTVLEAGN
jgi:2-polyprenyl-6-methoxyphenol hydroxylase-like FAD-dependent oxidoreductase